MAKEFWVTYNIKIDHKKSTNNRYFMKNLCSWSRSYHNEEWELKLPSIYSLLPRSRLTGEAEHHAPPFWSPFNLQKIHILFFSKKKIFVPNEWWTSPVFSFSLCKITNTNTHSFTRTACHFTNSRVSYNNSSLASTLWKKWRIG